MNNLYLFIFLLFSNTIISSFNISNINRVTKKKILDNLSLVSKSYFVNQLKNETEIEEIKKKIRDKKQNTNRQH